MKISMEHGSNYTDRGKQNYWDKTCPSVALFATYLSLTDPRSNIVFRGERPATYGLNHCMTGIRNLARILFKILVRTAQ